MIYKKLLSIHRAAFALVLACTWQCVLASDAIGERRRLLVLDDFGSVSTPDDPRISPDGRHIAFTFDDRIYIVARDDEPRALTAKSSTASQPRWSADGTYLYFVSDRSGSDQLWRLPLDTAVDAVQLTTIRNDVSTFDLSPDASRILFSMSDDDLAGESDDDVPLLVTRRQFKRDEGHGYITAAETRHLYVLDIATETLTQITSGDYSETDAAWSPDGQSVVFVSNREDPDADYRNDLWIVGAEGGDADWLKLTDDEHTKQSPAYSPDGKLVAYITAEDGVYGQQRVAVVPAAGGEPRILTAALDRWVSSLAFSEDSSWIYFNYDDEGSTHLARVRVGDGHIDKLVEGEVQVSAFDAGRSVAVTMNNRDDPGDVYLLRGRDLARLTELNSGFLSEVRLGDRFKVTAESADGTPVDAFITTPPDYQPGRSYPAVLKIHGGPVWRFAWGFSFSAQYLAANGYVVVEPNPRGSTGHGQAYIRAIYETWGVADYADVIAAIDHAVDEGFADRDRLAVTGYSYGGYMTNVVITNTTRFKAAASGAGHSLIEANFGHDIYQQWYMWELGAPWENRDKYDRLSPFLRVGNVETPTLFYGGRIDWNVPILNAELMYQALKVRGIDSELVVYPGIHHGDWPDEFEKDYQRRVVEWFDRYLKH